MITIQQAHDKIANLEAFNAGNLTAFWTDNGTMIGTYRVYSYGVQIAECGPNRYQYVTGVKYSKTTSKHANIVKRAWSLI